MQSMIKFMWSIVDLQLIKFLMVGSFVFVFYTFVLYILINVLEIYYPIGVTFAFCISVFTHFFLNRKFSLKLIQDI